MIFWKILNSSLKNIRISLFHNRRPEVRQSLELKTEICEITLLTDLLKVEFRVSQSVVCYFSNILQQFIFRIFYLWQLKYEGIHTNSTYLPLEYNIEAEF